MSLVSLSEASTTSDSEHSVAQQLLSVRAWWISPGYASGRPWSAVVKQTYLDNLTQPPPLHL